MFVEGSGFDDCHGSARPMMPGNVFSLFSEGAVSDDGTATRPESIISFLSRFGLVDREVPELDKLTLPELQRGDEHIGDLTPEEELIYRNYHVVGEQLEDLSRNISAGLLQTLGQAVKDRKDKELLSEAPPVDEVHGNNYFECERKQAALKGWLFYMITQRLGYSAHVVGIRTRGRIVARERKF